MEVTYNNSGVVRHQRDACFPLGAHPSLASSSCPKVGHKAICTPRILPAAGPQKPFTICLGTPIPTVLVPEPYSSKKHGGRHCAPIWRRAEGMRSSDGTTEHVLTDE
jgi:hypothetical protein